MQNFSRGNEIVFQENEHVGGGTHFHMNDFTRRLVFTKRHKRTRKWPSITATAYRIANGTNVFLRLLCK